MGEALREAYGDLFHIKEKLSETDRPAIEGKFKSTHNASDRVAEAQAGTFLALLKHADLETSPPPKVEKDESETPPPPTPERVNVE